MNVASTAHQQTTSDQRAHEPSMEEILASIRRIIADDDVLPLSRQPSTAARPANSAPQPGPSPFGAFEAPRTALRREHAYEAPQPSMSEPAQDSLDTPLLSAGADASVSSSFNALAASMMMQNGGLIEESVREMLRPMLKSWLDDNLPGIVERLVRQEIERMARGQR